MLEPIELLVQDPIAIWQSSARPVLELDGDDGDDEKIKINKHWTDADDANLRNMVFAVLPRVPRFAWLNELLRALEPYRRNGMLPLESETDTSKTIRSASASASAVLLQRERTAAVSDKIIEFFSKVAESNPLLPSEWQSLAALNKGAA